MNEERFTRLLDQYVTGAIQAPEQQEFFALLEEPAYRSLLEKKLELEWQEGQYEENENEQIGRLVEQYVMNKISNEQQAITMPRARIVNRQWYVAVAAAIILLALAGAWFFWQQAGKKQPPAQDYASVTDAMPGGNKAVLILGNGQKILLDSARNGVVVQQGTVAVNKLDNGKLSYSKGSNEKETVFNTISTPRGGQYQVQLPDGSWVWLNAASSLRFPTAFNGSTRTVEITGEAYFEVTHNAAQPFKVIANGTTTEVLGTHFNVHAYNDEALLKTTLVEGKVKITKGNAQDILKPGQQAQVSNDNRLTVVDNVDMDEVLAWKNGLFRFSNADIETVMKQVERWYDVDVVYEGERPTGHYRGKVPRDVKASEMLKIIEASGVHYRIENKKIIIMK
jgi:ferric-dicitrate binding protein FerR (iron transport regulator)